MGRDIFYVLKESAHENEHEVLFAPGAEFWVIGHKQQVDEQYIFEMEEIYNNDELYFYKDCTLITISLLNRIIFLRLFFFSRTGMREPQPSCNYGSREGI
jgi:hypothetical protein